ncbi:MAG: nickel pincer cofactor biosynthesis protein LarC [Deltaproteobacteria bacterium]|nr:nickel pincer cofactor biosynthesis protein LarC [Deltaproteobacteria bacterium]
MKTAYLDCFSGVSGDMFLGALIDAGLPFEVLEGALAALPLEGYRLRIRREEKSHLFGTRFLVDVDRSRQVPRGLREIEEILSRADLNPAVRRKSLSVFEAIALEEGRIHDRPPDRVHFHEVGAVDSIIDVVGAAFGLDWLGVGSLFCSPLPLGSGFVETAHGRIPVPAPATVALLKGIPQYGTGLGEELVTPTGAALVRVLASSFGPMPPMRVQNVGYGVGSRDLPDRPNLLRIMIGDAGEEEGTETLVLLEANLDDTPPEWLGFLMERLLAAGALDVVFCPVQMKKNRPGVLVQVLANPHLRDELMDIVFRETTTTGIRFRYSQRRILDRVEMEVDSPWGQIRVKGIRRPDGTLFLSPEYEACRKIADEKDVPLKDVYSWVTALNGKATR